jgi:hypothetical protein
VKYFFPPTLRNASFSHSEIIFPHSKIFFSRLWNTLKHCSHIFLALWNTFFFTLWNIFFHIFPPQWNTFVFILLNIFFHIFLTFWNNFLTL